MTTLLFWTYLSSSRTKFTYFPLKCYILCILSVLNFHYVISTTKRVFFRLPTVVIYCILKFLKYLHKIHKIRSVEAYKRCHSWDKKKLLINTICYTIYNSSSCQGIQTPAEPNTGCIPLSEANVSPDKNPATDLGIDTDLRVCCFYYNSLSRFVSSFLAFLKCALKWKSTAYTGSEWITLHSRYN